MGRTASFESAGPARFASGQAYLALCVAVLAIVGYLVWHLADTRLGRAMRAVRDNELAAGVIGIDVFRTKVIAFALCAVLGGLGGGLFAGGFAYVSPDQFSFADSIVLLTMALLGGVASPIGSAIGTGLLILIPEWLRFLKSVPGLYLAIYGAAVILIIVFMPDGIWGFIGTVVPNAASAPRRSRPSRCAASRRLGGGDVVLEVRGLAKHFGGLKAVDGVDFQVRRGGVHALIGPNGSGKTTTLNVLSGLYVATAGTVLLDGADITDARRRISAPPPASARTFQNIRLFRSMTALENVVIGAERPGNRSSRGGDDALRRRALAALDFVGLGGRADEPIPSFSYGHQRLIEIARALAANPTCCCSTSPPPALTRPRRWRCTNCSSASPPQGLTILIIDHDMTLVAGAAQHLPCSISAAASRTANRRPCCAIPTSSPPISGARDGAARDHRPLRPLRRDRSAARRLARVDEGAS